MTVSEMTQTTNLNETLLGIDVGERRIGVARAQLGALFPHPLETLQEPATFISDIVNLCRVERAAALIIGLPRGLSGQDTAQTEQVRVFGAKLESQLDIPVYWTDEALTSAKAEDELRQRGRPYAKGEVDALAATYILDDFITHNKGRISELNHG